MNYRKQTDSMTTRDHVSRAPLTPGRLITAEADSSGLSLSFQLYLPADLDPSRPVLTAVHGISRNPQDWMDRLRARADASRAPLLTPLFSESRYSDFQRLGRHGKGERADHALIRLVESLSAEYGFSPSMGLFGFSGGAQFAHRFVLAHPGRVASLVLGAAGWYTWPDPTTAFPYGTRPINSLPGVRFDPLNLLSVPMRVIVGERDTARDASLNCRKRIDTQQGRNRVVRAENWVRALRRYAQDNHIHCRIDYHPLAGADHAILESDFGEVFGQLVCDWIYQDFEKN